MGKTRKSRRPSDSLSPKPKDPNPAREQELTHLHDIGRDENELAAAHAAGPEGSHGTVNGALGANGTAQSELKANGGVVRIGNAEVDEAGRAYLGDEKWQQMGTPALAGGRRKAGGQLDRLFTKLYGNLPMEERARVAWLAGTLFCIVGGYWLLRSLKDPIVSVIVGVERIPQCKMVSLVVVSVVVLVYNKLVDMFPKHQLFYIVGGFYTVVFGSIAYLLNDPVIGIHNTTPSPDRLLGWVSYCAIESFGSVCVQLFWAFVNSSMNLEGAKSAYGLIIAGAQIGSILGPSVATQAQSLGVPLLYCMGAGCMGLMVGMVWGYVRVFGVAPALVETPKDKKNVGVLEGAHLLIKYHYIKGIFALSCVFMIEGTIIDYMMKILAQKRFAAEYPDDPIAATQGFAAFMGNFGQVANSVSFMFSLLGTSMVIRRLGLNRTLLAFPVLLFSIACMVIMFPDLYVVFAAMIMLKGFSYSLNNPCKEMLYQPTSTAVKFKSKSWIDIFGARGSKALGSVVTNHFSDSLPSLVHFGGGVILGVSSFLVWVAYKMGKKFEELSESGEVVGEETQYDQAFMPLDELASNQVQGDTSCGILEEGQLDDDEEHDLEGTPRGVDPDSSLRRVSV